MLKMPETARKINQETDLPIKLRNELSDQYAESAVYLLTCSDEKAGYFESPARRAQLRDPRLKPLQGRKDFKDLLDPNGVLAPGRYIPTGAGKESLTAQI